VALIATSAALPWVCGVAVSIAVGLMFVGAFRMSGDEPSSPSDTAQTASRQQSPSSATARSVARAIGLGALLAFVVTWSVAALDAPHFASIAVGVAVYVVVAALLVISDERRRVD
jgi:Flp pilus assembly protein TadB